MDTDADGTKEADGVIVRDYTNTQTNIKASDAVAKIKQALTQANNIGATSKAASVTPEFSLYTPATDTVQTLANNADAKVTLTDDVYAYNTTDKTFKLITQGTDIREIYESGGYEFYDKTAIVAGSSVGIDASSKTTSDILLQHQDAVAAGISATVSAGYVTTNGTYAGKGIENNGNVSADYKAYKKTNIEDLIKIEGATDQARGNLNAADNATVTFEAIDTSSLEKAENMKAGQNALIDALDAGKISMTYTDAADGTAVFSHDDMGADNPLDVRENGEVYYNDVKVATLKSTATTSTAGQTITLGQNTDTFAKAHVENVHTNAVPEGSTCTFTIDKGQTEVADDLTLNLHVGADADMTNKISVGIAAMDSTGLGISGINVADDSGVAATYAIDAIEDAIKTVSAQRSALGAVQNRLEHTISNLDNVVENTTSAESAIRDTDMASEMVNFSKNNILAQAGQSMLAQANQSTQGVLALFQSLQIP